MAGTTEELVLDIGPQLIELVNRELPMVVSRSAPVPRRTLIALTVKVTAIMCAIVDLIEKKRLPEVMILARSLADHVITLAWITVDVDQHYPRWEKDDAKQRLDARRHWQESGRGPLLDPEAIARYEQILTIGPKVPTRYAAMRRASRRFLGHEAGLPSWRPPVHGYLHGDLPSLKQQNPCLDPGAQ
jgi:hypothetical protein